MAQRYATCNYSEFDYSAKGEWVKAIEHEAEINQLKAQVAKLQADNTALHDALSGYNDLCDAYAFLKIESDKKIRTLERALALENPS